MGNKINGRNTQLYWDLHELAAKTRSMRFKDKSNSEFMESIAKLMELVPKMDPDRFMTSITTHLGGVVYWSRKLTDLGPGWSKAKTLAHEMVHRDQELKWGLWFGFTYAGWRLLIIPLLVMWLLCLIQAIHCFVALWVPVVASFWWWNLWSCLAASAVLLPPWPVGTAYWEYPAYAVSMWMDHRRGVDITRKDYLDWYVDIFTGPVYYFMQWSKHRTRKRLEVWRDRVLDGTLSQHVPTVSDLESVVSRYYPET